MSFLGDLFSCGRARRTRETSTEPLETDDATPEPVNAHGTTATTTHPTIEKPNGIPAPQEDRIERVADQVRVDPQPNVEKRGSGLTQDDIELAVIPEKSKPSAGWMVEQRVLVTATPATKQDISMPEPEQKHEQEHETRAPTPSVRCATPEQEPWNSTPVAQAATEPEASDMTVTTLVQCATSESDTRAATPDVTVVHEQTSEQTITLVEDETSEPALVEAATSSAELEDVVEDVPTPKKSAPVQLLDLPPGMSDHNRLAHTCANKTQR
jgi:hypothetical protein